MCICHNQPQDIHLGMDGATTEGTILLISFKISTVSQEIPLRYGAKRSPLR